MLRSHCRIIDAKSPNLDYRPIWLIIFDYLQQIFRLLLLDQAWYGSTVPLVTTPECKGTFVMIAILPMSELVAMPNLMLSAFITLRSGLSPMASRKYSQRPSQRETQKKPRRK